MAEPTKYDRMMGNGVPDVDKEYSRAKRRVEDSEKWRKNAKYDETWSDLIKLYANKYPYDELKEYSDIVAPNLVFSTVNVIVPSIAINYPKITVTARRPEYDAQSATVEAAANYYWRRSNVHEEFRAVVKDFSIIGHGWCKTTWAYEEKEQEWEPDAWQAELQKLLEERNLAQQAAIQSGAPDAFPSDEDIIGTMPKKQVVVVRDEPSVERISPFDVLVDPDSTRPQNMRWIAQKMYVPWETAVAREDWDKRARKKLSKAAMSEAKKEQDTLYPEETRGTEAEFAVVYEYYDLIAGTVCTFGQGCDDWLKAPEAVPFPFKHPFVPVMNYSVPEKFYPIGDVEAVKPLQLELALTRTQMVNDRKRFRRMYMYNPEAIGPDGVDNLLSSDDNAMIPVEGNIPFNECIAPIQTTPLPPEFYNQTAMILDDINLVSGVTEYQRGSVAEVRRTATEASMIQDMANARSADKLTTIERAIGEVAERVVALAQLFLDGEDVAKVVGPDGALTWQTYSKEQIAGEYDYEVEAGSTQPQNETFRRQSAMQLMDAMAPFVELGVVDPSKLAEHVLRNGFGIKQPGLFMMQPMMGPDGMPVQPGVPLPDQGTPPGGAGV